MRHQFLIREKGKKPVAELFYDENSCEYSLKIYENVNTKDMPAILMILAEQGRFEVGDDIARMFVKERVIPSDRQNIGDILATYGFKFYDEFLFLVADEGRCCMDDFYLEKVSTQNGEVAMKNKFEIVKEG